MKPVKNKIILMHTAMMPHEGYYKMCKISKNAFKNYLKYNYIESYIGYKNVQEVIFKAFNERVLLNRGNTILKNGDKILIIKLKHRPKNPCYKKGDVLGKKLGDYGLFLCRYFDNQNDFINYLNI